MPTPGSTCSRCRSRSTGSRIGRGRDRDDAGEPERPGAAQPPLIAAEDRSRDRDARSTACRRRRSGPCRRGPTDSADVPSLLGVGVPVEECSEPRAIRVRVAAQRGLARRGDAVREIRRRRRDGRPAVERPRGRPLAGHAAQDQARSDGSADGYVRRRCRIRRSRRSPAGRCPTRRGPDARVGGQVEALVPVPRHVEADGLSACAAGRGRRSRGAAAAAQAAVTWAVGAGVDRRRGVRRGLAGAAAGSAGRGAAGASVCAHARGATASAAGDRRGEAGERSETKGVASAKNRARLRILELLFVSAAFRAASSVPITGRARPASGTFAPSRRRAPRRGP